MEKLKNKLVSILRWSERYTKTDMVYIAKGGFWLTSNQVIGAVVSFLLAIAFGNMLPQEVYGTYRYAIYIAGILSALTLTGMNTSVAQAVARGFEGTLKKSFLIQVKWNLIVLAAGIIGGLYYLINGNLTLAGIFFIIGFLSPILYSANTYTAFLNGKKDFERSAKFSVISVLISAGASFITILLTNNVIWLISVYFLANSSLSLFFYYHTIRARRPNHDLDINAISYGKHLSFINIVATAASFLDGILVFHFLGTAPLAIYAFATAPVDQIKGLAKKLPVLFMPKLATRTFREIDSILYNRLLQLLIIGIIIATAYIVIVPYFFEIFFPQYLTSIPVSKLYALTLIFALPINLLAAKGQAKLTQTPKKLLYKAIIIPPWFLIISLLILTPTLGITGVVLSRIIHTFVNVFVDIYYWKKAVSLNTALD